MENLKTILLGISAMIISVITGVVMINICRTYFEGNIETFLVIAISIFMIWGVLKQIPWIIEYTRK